MTSESRADEDKIANLYRPIKLQDPPNAQGLARGDIDPEAGGAETNDPGERHDYRGA
ncbi:hypothetical protein J2Y48_004042 [Mycoplana sp. BE70]|nr:hypothetical protein [Mycoplana sp. BE70]